MITAENSRRGKRPWVLGAQVLLAAMLLLPGGAWGIGILVPRNPDYQPIGQGAADVKVQVRNNLAKTRIVQEFFNPNPQQLEADFFFPIPKGADVTDFVLYMDGKPVKGEVLEKEKAREIYEGIVRRLKDPGLVEWMDYNLFKMRIFPVPANGTQKIELEFAQPLEADQGMFRYTFPLKGPGRGAGMERSGPAADVKFAVDVESDDPIRNVYSPSHPIDSDQKDNRKVHVSVPSSSFGPSTGDFVLYYELSKKDIALSLLGYKPVGEDGFFSLMLSPPTETSSTADTQVGSDVVFVIDTSGSMTDDDKITQARKALTYCVGQLKAKDRFNIIRFSTDVERFRTALLEANADNIGAAKTWIGKLEARGGTNISGALQETAALHKEIGPGDGNDKRIYTVVFITDGLPTVGVTQPDKIVKETLGQLEGDGVRVFTFGVGFDVNTKLLDQLAAETRAASDYIKPKQDMELPIGRFFDKVNRPAMTGLKLELTNAEAYDLYPKEIPDLFYGGQLTVFGRYKKSGPAAIKLVGRVGDKPTELVYEKTLPDKTDDNGFVEKLWGTRKIAYLLDQIRRSGETKETKDEVVSLAKKYGIVTPYTSYLVAEDKDMQPERPMRAGLPTGSMRRPESPGFSDRFSRQSASNTTVEPRPARAMDMAGSGAAQAPASYALKSAPTESGEKAVEYSQSIRKMKEAKAESEVGGFAGTRNASGKTFRLDGGVWIDSRLETNEVATLKVKYLSQAYFDILKKFPELKEVFALGTEFRVKLSNGVLEISSQGIETIEPARLNELKP